MLNANSSRVWMIAPNGNICSAEPRAYSNLHVMHRDHTPSRNVDARADGIPLVGWRVNGIPVGGTTVHVTIEGDVTTVEALYRSRFQQPIPMLQESPLDQGP